MRLYMIIAASIVLLLATPAVVAQTGDDGDAVAYEDEFIRFTVPEGWEASGIRDEMHMDLARFDDRLKCVPVEVTPDDDTAGLMILVSGRDDTHATLFDFIVLTKAPDIEIYDLFQGEMEIIDAAGDAHDARLTINALDDGASGIVICHNLVTFVGDTRIEFAYIAPMENYGPNFAELEMFIESVEFK